MTKRGMPITTGKHNEQNLNNTRAHIIEVRKKAHVGILRNEKSQSNFVALTMGSKDPNISISKINDISANQKEEKRKEG
uniref:Uncharacterized protein n=1 Tax=Salix viminalis TaxID=40686 RepID=A0A6N2LZE4_SALVM